MTVVGFNPRPSAGSQRAGGGTGQTLFFPGGGTLSPHLAVGRVAGRRVSALRPDEPAGNELIRRLFRKRRRMPAGTI